MRTETRTYSWSFAFKPGWGLAVTAVIGLVLAWLLVELVFLRGTVVQRGTLTLGEPFAVAVSEAGVPHAIEIAGPTRGSRPPEFRLRVRVTDSGGATLLDRTDALARTGSHHFAFTPPRAGSYELRATDEKAAARTGSALRVTVSVGDRRVLTRLIF